MNLSYMVGVGWNSIQFPLKCDRLGGQLPPGQPRGYIPFGFQTWMAFWLGPQVDGTWNPNEERMFPAGRDWPFQERYVDWAIDPCMNECCVDSGPLTAAYNTGFLMAQSAGRKVVMFAVARLLNDGNTNKGNTMETSARHRMAATSGGNLAD